MLCDEVVRSLRARGHRVSVLCGRGRDLPSYPDLSGALEIDLDRKEETFLGGRLPSPWEAVRLHLFSPRSFKATRRWLAERRPDVVIVWNLLPGVAVAPGRGPTERDARGGPRVRQVALLRAVRPRGPLATRGGLEARRAPARALHAAAPRPGVGAAPSSGRDQRVHEVGVRAGRARRAQHRGDPPRRSDRRFRLRATPSARRRRAAEAALRRLALGRQGPADGRPCPGQAPPGRRARPPRRLRRRGPPFRGVPEAGHRGGGCRGDRDAARPGGARRGTGLLPEPRRPRLPEPMGRALCRRADRGHELRDGGGRHDRRRNARGDRGR